ncbi:MAG TPA: hypothetical protein H9809_02965 [Candidatus Blautia pullicola]|uniref:Uncharacterized protein n=1 Tax=Candidatus Blautia pullicola TaxID=2838498 RepID=A0A9D2JSF3_9FIRM|nr:hypothetical protein [Candidatus Blautia pullicola]
MPDERIEEAVEELVGGELQENGLGNYKFQEYPDSDRRGNLQFVCDSVK